MWKNLELKDNEVLVLCELEKELGLGAKDYAPMILVRNPKKLECGFNDEVVITHFSKTEGIKHRVAKAITYFNNLGLDLLAQEFELKGYELPLFTEDEVVYNITHPNVEQKGKGQSIEGESIEDIELDGSDTDIDSGGSQSPDGKPKGTPDVEEDERDDYVNKEFIGVEQKDGEFTFQKYIRIKKRR